MDDMTPEQAQAEALRRWGTAGRIEFHPPRRPGASRGRLARYSCKVDDGGGTRSVSVEGQGNTWREAFADARPR